ncbi:MAG TPA: flavin reductase family protein [Persephonella sp.]|uniref:Flavin reductase domain protein, FMN-binding n=1 Tax=Persephonella marina (strain DSM 14350 / EX-H1) TaxID=123214 RepID=C0QRX9_PERMH|nr:MULTISPECIES: flavin reductase family protein [Persephonella]ACO04890.1 flavin reductase domain protein, FMN-binding [Persephonella marina EX-H1]HCB69170.1 flavin reductase family protein [Persephonella sp.]
MEIKTENLEPKNIYKLMTSVIVPRPIAWISTVSPEGINNLAPFSYYAGISSDPPLVVVSIGSKEPGVKKDTWRNIEETGEFVINLVTRDLLEEMNISSIPFESEIDEFEKTGLTPAPSTYVKAPRVKESPVNIECRKYEIIQIGKMGIILGQVLNFHIRDDILNEKGYVDTTELEIIGRLGGANYCLITKENTFELKRPDKR